MPFLGRLAYLCLGALLALVAVAQAASVQLEWDYVQEPSHLATGFILDRCDGTACTNFLPLMSTPIPLTPLLYTDSSVQAGKSYRWQVRAVDAAGGSSAASNAVGFSVPQKEIAPPMNLRGVLGP